MRFDKPNACNQCHLDWSVNRAIAATKRLWPDAYAKSEAGDQRFDEPEGQRALFAGDAVMRALTAGAMMPANELTGPLLLQAMQDRYPIVRYFAANDLAAGYPMFPKPDYLARPEIRNATVRRLVFTLVDRNECGRAEQTRARLSATRTEVDVDVGE